MKNIKSKILWLLLVPLAWGIFSCTAKKETPQKTEASVSKAKIETYTCSMHPWVRSDKPGRCPVCGMDLVPVYAEEHLSGHAMDGVENRVAVKLSTTKLQLIGVKTEAVELRPLSREIHLPARVAYDPGLVVAQSDYLIALNTSGGELGGIQGGLVQSAKTRLKLLGMNEEQISRLRKRGKPNLNLLVPQKGESVLIYAAAYESDLPWIHEGMQVEVKIPGESGSIHAPLASIDPIIDPMTRTVQLRFPIRNPEGKFRPEMFLQVVLQSEGDEVISVPESAILDSGTRQIVYVETEPGHFTPRQLETGRRGTDYVEVISGVKPGEKVVVNGNFMIDSESSLKSTLGGSGGHQH